MIKKLNCDFTVQNYIRDCLLTNVCGRQTIVCLTLTEQTFKQTETACLAQNVLICLLLTTKQIDVCIGNSLLATIQIILKMRTTICASANIDTKGNKDTRLAVHLLALTLTGNDLIVACIMGILRAAFVNGVAANNGVFTN